MNARLVLILAALVSSFVAPIGCGSGGGGGDSAATLSMVGNPNIDLPGKTATGTVAAGQPATVSVGALRLSAGARAAAADSQIILKEFDGFPAFAVPEGRPTVAPWVACVSRVYDVGPEGLSFEEPVSVTIGYDKTLIPKGADERNACLLYYNGRDWVSIDSTVDVSKHSVTARVQAFPGAGFLAAIPYGVKLAAVTAVAVVAWYEAAGPIVSQVVKDPIYHSDAHTYVTPQDPVVKDYSKRTVLEIGGGQYREFDSPASLNEWLRLESGVQRKIGFTAGSSVKTSTYVVSEDWASDWVKPAEYFNTGMRGDCKNVANAYCSVLRAQGFSARCVDGFTGPERHVWVEVEIQGKPYYVGDEGEIMLLDKAIKDLSLVRGMDGKAFMWDERGQTAYQANWWASATKVPDFTKLSMWVFVEPDWKIIGEARSRARAESLNYVMGTWNGIEASIEALDMQGRWTSPNRFEVTVDRTLSTEFRDSEYTLKIIVDFDLKLTTVSSFWLTAAQKGGKSEVISRLDTSMSGLGIPLSYKDAQGHRYFILEGADIARSQYGLTISAKEVFRDNSSAEFNTFRCTPGSRLLISLSD